jgi:hypothetical protein
MRLPAYGRRLIDERRAGRHPIEVTVVYGDKWRDHGQLKICIKPEEFLPGVYNFHILAGLRVLVVDQLGESSDLDEKVIPPTFGKFYDLLAEIAAADAWVTLRYPQYEAFDRDIANLALCAKWWSHETRSMQWPRWWNEELHAKHERRWSMWQTHRAYALGILERERGRAA